MCVYDCVCELVRVCVCIRRKCAEIYKKKENECEIENKFGMSLKIAK